MVSGELCRLFLKMLQPRRKRDAAALALFAIFVLDFVNGKLRMLAVNVKVYKPTVVIRIRLCKRC